MEKLRIEGGRQLRGYVEVSGAKNSAVALLPATLLAQENSSVLENLPQIRDVHLYKDLLTFFGAHVLDEKKVFTVDATNVSNKMIVNGVIKQLRASYYLMGALLGRFGEAAIGLPGGCNLGPRPIDQHLKGFEALGAEITHQDGAIYLKAPKLQGARIYLDVVSVGATINIMLAASKAEGITTIENASKEPEIVDVATFLTTMGAEIKGAGTDVIRIRGCERLSGCRQSIIPDRIEAGTYMIAAAATQGDVTVTHLIPKHMESVTAKLREIGVVVEEGDETLRVRGQPSYQSIDIKTLPYPGFPTDLQQPLTTLLTQAQGTSLITENIYFSRFRHVDELYRMGAQIRVEGRTAVVEGTSLLFGTGVRATDLRAGAALVIAGLVAKGVTEITEVEHIDRGYERIVDKFVALGGNLLREGS